MESFYVKALFISILGICSCHSSQQETIPTKYSNPHEFVTVKGKDIYERGEKATFVIKNKSKEQDILLYHPKKMLIEKHTGEGWERINIRYCPCGASCPPPPTWGALKAQATKTIRWDLNEEWCEDTNSERKVPETKKKYAGEGTYRFVLRYSLDKGKEMITEYKSFKLK